MKDRESRAVEDYLKKEVAIIVEELFSKLKENNINVQLRRNELKKEELDIYLILYKEYEENLIKLKDKVIAKFGYINNFDYVFAKIIESVVSKK